MVRSVRMSADECYVAGKILPGKLHSYGLSTFDCKTVFCLIIWVKTYDVLVGFDFCFLKVLLSFSSEFDAFYAEGPGRAVDTIYEIAGAWYFAAFIIMYETPVLLIMLKSQIGKRSIQIGIFT